MSNPIRSTSFLNQEVTCSPTDDIIKYNPERCSGAVVCRSLGGKIGQTWSAKLTVLLFLTSVHIHAPGVEGEGEEVLEARGRTHHSVEAFQPFLTLFKGGELTPEGIAHTQDTGT